MIQAQWKMPSIKLLGQSIFHPHQMQDQPPHGPQMQELKAQGHHAYP